jgi:3-isopropylmalate/(R)-2-methylmalate dehydratase small subunit
VERSGFGQFLFFDWMKEPGFVLNEPRYKGARILLARENLGCGSSREHAPWALSDYGFTVLIAPSYADIFRNNCYQNGMLPIVLDGGLVDECFRRVTSNEGYTITVDLEAQTLAGSDGFSCTFEIDPFRKRCLLEGLDDIGLTLEQEAAIAAYEDTHRQPWQAGIQGGTA